MARVFRKMAGNGGYLNASVEGIPKLDAGRLELELERAFLNGQKVPRAALAKRGGMSPEDFLENRVLYLAVVGVLSEVRIAAGKATLRRKR